MDQSCKHQKSSKTSERTSSDSVSEKFIKNKKLHPNIRNIQKQRKVLSKLMFNKFFYTQKEWKIKCEGKISPTWKGFESKESSSTRSWRKEWSFLSEEQRIPTQSNWLKELIGLGFIKPTNPSWHVSTPSQLPIQLPRLIKPHRLTWVKNPIKVSNSKNFSS